MQGKRSLHVNHDSKSESLAVGQDQAHASQIDRHRNRRNSFSRGAYSSRRSAKCTDVACVSIAELQLGV